MSVPKLRAGVGDVERERDSPQRRGPGDDRHGEVDDRLHGLHEPEVEKLFPGRPVAERRDESLPESNPFGRLAGRGFDVDSEESACACAIDRRSAADQVEGRGQDRQPDERDQQARAGGKERREEREPDDAEAEVEQEVERRKVRAALD
jgi:hypothetical protein